MALITGGDSSIGRAVAIAFTKEDADVAVVYLEEHKDANETRRLLEEHARKVPFASYFLKPFYSDTSHQREDQQYQENQA